MLTQLPLYDQDPFKASLLKTSNLSLVTMYNEIDRSIERERERERDMEYRAINCKWPLIDVSTIQHELFALYLKSTFDNILFSLQKLLFFYMICLNMFI